MRTVLTIAAILATASAVLAAETHKTFKVIELRGGGLSIEGKAIAIRDLDSAFEEIAKQHGHVAYYREATYESPDATTADVLRLAEKYNFVVRLARKPDFSDIEGETKEPAKAIVLFAPKPDYPEVARKQHLTGAGIFVLHVDPFSGIVKSVVTEKSTGHTLLDHCATAALQKWRFKPNTFNSTMARIPITFTQTGRR
jgi:TonB family protein